MKPCIVRSTIVNSQSYILIFTWQILIHKLLEDLHKNSRARNLLKLSQNRTSDNLEIHNLTSDVRFPALSPLRPTLTKLLNTFRIRLQDLCNQALLTLTTDLSLDKSSEARNPPLDRRPNRCKHQEKFSIFPTSRDFLSLWSEKSLEESNS